MLPSINHVIKVAHKASPKKARKLHKQLKQFECFKFEGNFEGEDGWHPYFLLSRVDAGEDVNNSGDEQYYFMLRLTTIPIEQWIYFRKCGMCEIAAPEGDAEAAVGYETKIVSWIDGVRYALDFLKKQMGDSIELQDFDLSTTGKGSLFILNWSSYR